MFEITSDDIAALNDRDLRTLVGRLCEAELRARDLPVSSATWGGNQTAKDGGLDVHVALSDAAAIEGFVPRRSTGFQVKKPDMPRAKILHEMRPKGRLRRGVAELIQASGAYIIASGQSATSYEALANRRAAMREALLGVAGAEHLFVDFYDGNRLATWVRKHPALVPWVLATIGRPMRGWRSHGTWSRAQAGLTAYLVDEEARITTRGTDETHRLPITQGVDRIRDVLRAPGGVARLVGLSGVGKTRLAEALFDQAVGLGSLDPAWAFYADLADDPFPPPSTVVSQLVAARRRAIVVVDNCSSDAHRQLSEATGAAGTTVALLTIEYDIRDDQPETTEVFSLGTSSSELIEKLVASRFGNLSQVDVRTIAGFSDGNARIAFALAEAVAKTGSISGLNDADLLRRLFWQRHEPDASLWEIAQACALVYSFEGETVSGAEAELPILGALVGRSPDDVYRAAAELKRRDLLQARGPWRAVLPHAIANRLATAALQDVSPAAVLSGLLKHSRLARSFSRRLGYLNGSQEARTMAQRWLAPQGLLADIANLNELGRAMLVNIAPVVPDSVLTAIEKALHMADGETIGRCSCFALLLRSIAYDPEHFERAVDLLVKMARLDEDPERGATSILASLFHAYLSGTQATQLQRAEAAERLLESADSSERRLGETVLRAMLKTEHFVGSYGFEFGARSRDYGYSPRTAKETHEWFAGALRLAERFGAPGSPNCEAVRSAVAAEMRGLWRRDPDGLERVSRAFSSSDFWRDGWIGAREAKVLDGRRGSGENSARLSALEELLRPKDLIERVRGTVIASAKDRFSIDDLEGVESHDYEATLARATAAAERLGADVVTNEMVLQTLLPELLVGGGKVTHFGRGVGWAAQHPRATWSVMIAQLATTETTSVELLGGFLEGLHRREPILVDALLDEALDDPLLARWVPALQRSTSLDEKALARLHKTLERDGAPIEAFYGFAYGRISHSIPPADFKRLVLAILDKPDGVPVALEMLYLRFHVGGTDENAVASELIEAGRGVLQRYAFHRVGVRAIHEDYALGTTIRTSLCGDEGKPLARRLCRALADGVQAYKVSAHDYGDTAAGLFQVQPFEVLDEMFSGDAQSQRNAVRLLDELLDTRRSPMDGIPDETLIAWCDRNPDVRYPLMAAVGVLFNRPSDNAPHEWTSLASKLLSRAPDSAIVLNEMVRRLYPNAWSGSRSVELAARLDLLERLNVSRRPDAMAEWEAAKKTLRRRIEAERRREREESRARGGRFE